MFSNLVIDMGCLRRNATFLYRVARPSFTLLSMDGCMAASKGRQQARSGALLIVLDIYVIGYFGRR